MKQMKLIVKILATLASLIVIFIACTVYIQRTYYFNPLTFRRDAVTPYAWKEYKKPMELNVVYQRKDGSAYRYTTQDRSEIGYVLSSLKQGKQNGTQFPDSLGQTVLEFRNPVSGENYLDAVIPDDSQFAFLFFQHAVTLSSGIEQFINDKRDYAQRIN